MARYNTNLLMTQIITIRPKANGFEARAGRKLSRWAKTEEAARARLELALSEMQWMEPQTITFSFIRQMYLNSLNSTTPGYKKNAALWLSQFPSLEKIDPSNIKQYHVQEEFNKLIERGLTFQTLATARKYWFGMFEAAVDNDFISRNPVRKIKIGRPDTTPKQVLLPNEILSLIVSSRGYAIHPFTVLCPLLGLSPGEVALLTPECFKHKGILIVPGKKAAGRYRTLPLPNVVAEEIRNHTFPFKYHKSNSNRDLRKRAAAAGLISIEPKTFKLEEGSRPIHCNLLRHSFSTGLQEMGVDEEKRARLMGHAKKTITQHYSHAQAMTFAPLVESWVTLVYSSGGNSGGNSKQKTATN